MGVWENDRGRPWDPLLEEKRHRRQHRIADEATFKLYEKSRRFYGLIGMKGHWGPVEAPVTHNQVPYHVNWEFRPPMAKLVDLTGGLWFLRRDWLHVMFRDDAFTLETGEDFQLGNAVKERENHRLHWHDGAIGGAGIAP
jgi:hypothetical protein